MTLPHALIIAGGQGQRLGGVRKADLRIGGSRQIMRVMAGLNDIASPILVAIGPRGRALTLPPQCRAVPDLESPCAGPLAGLAAAVLQLAESGIVEGLLVSVAVDTFFLPPDFVTRMVEGLGEATAAYAAWGEDFYPPNAVWQLAALQDLPHTLDTPEAPVSLKSLQHSLEARRVDWAGIGGANPFANINTLADLLTLQRMGLE